MHAVIGKLDIQIVSSRQWNIYLHISCLLESSIHSKISIFIQKKSKKLKNLIQQGRIQGPVALGYTLPQGLP